ncbi:hypothetical protein VHEMI03110 [[Torrubiella] hemipterigena]|uniref:Uncharacterized protein n=1 Tax=[Torrubiella] hemipterigena TaxID=1531966 RepID=A0A0A1TA62_9HYPO|nr:hypothetical protein VHEMI03110 [[Torrubiella] hemipterigena]
MAYNIFYTRLSRTSQAIAASPENQATLSIDLGIRSVRLCLDCLHLVQKNRPPVPVPYHLSQVKDDFDFNLPVHIDMFGADRDPWRCLYAEESKRTVPAKLLFVVIRISELRHRNNFDDRSVADRYMRCIPQLRAFFALHDAHTEAEQEEAIARGLQAFDCLLQSLKIAANALAVRKKYSIKKVAFSVPMYWDEWMIHHLQTRIQAVWNTVPLEDILVYHDSEALLQLFEYQGCFRVQSNTQFVSVHYSGHILQATTVLVRPIRNQKPEVLRSDWSFSEHGGLLAYKAALRTELYRIIEQKTSNDTEKDQLVSSALQYFESNIQATVGTGSLQLTAATDRNRSMTISVDRAFNQRAHRQYLANPVTQLIKQLKILNRDRLLQSPPRDICLLLTGDTFRHEPSRQRVEIAAQELNMTVRFPEQELEQAKKPISSRQLMCFGAAIAVRQLPTVSEYFDTVALGIALGDPANPSELINLPWIDRETIQGHVDIQSSSPEHADAWLVCRPRSRLPSTVTPLFNSYTVMSSLGRLRTGRYTMRVLTSTHQPQGEPVENEMVLLYNRASMAEAGTTRWKVRMSTDCHLSLDLQIQDDVLHIKGQPLEDWAQNVRGKRSYAAWVATNKDPAYRYWETRTRLPTLTWDAGRGRLSIRSTGAERRVLRPTSARQRRAVCVGAQCPVSRRRRGGTPTCPCGRLALPRGI